ncbi:endopeptidase catalytic subunit KNAG_0M02290 [Huiozyma naganishii CBS 8797]|uniref:Mitochondrial inner membrane protease subunit 2 n=1 Tax=Huiozyma naganishii (strain ATCC MYA-139 / BCRC 22969 / CBS 8797 / KCTC 17520 / NBRC 10181 / NCYC 3082 / Yp74L-3) TaxID=1071383 RepID=J7S4A2_HUIN7|nr:hypothetical protein KNAG_0M02290 [Kazachstania naganishii CBS 8797]CCK73082.1 hypothetical protein KNAG_0M02290 [Kazachstania naganishii CBS 8797]
MVVRVRVRSLFWAVSWIPVALAATDVVHVSRIEGSSMRPTLNSSDGDTDWVLLKMLWPRARAVGDIVLLKSPFDPAKVMCKRVKALASDTVRVPDGEPITVPRGHLWVEGDNVHSIDSRKFGPVSDGLLLGKVLCVVWPPSKWGVDLHRYSGRNVVVEE